MAKQQRLKPNTTQKDNPKNRRNSYALFSGLAIQMFAIIDIGTYIGVKLNESYPNPKNGYTLAFSLAAVIASIVYVIKRIIAASKDNK